MLPPHSAPEPEVALRLDGVTKSYGEPKPAVDGVSLKVRAGEFVAVLGPSGSGKTTLLRLLAGFLTPDTGRVFLAGDDVTSYSARRRNIGVVFQHFALFPNMSAFDNVAFPLRARHLPKAEIAERVSRILTLVELPEHAHKRPRQLSGGQQQRVALARALVFEPRLLLMDEPLASLDRRLRQSLQVGIRRLQRQLGVPAVYVTHDQEEAMSMADRIVVLHDGKVEADGAPSELYEHPPSRFVATFLGDANLVVGVFERDPAGGERVRVGGVSLPVAPVNGRAPNAGARVTVVVRPERVRVGAATSGLACEVLDTAFLGGRTRVWLRTIDVGHGFVADVNDVVVAPGERVGIAWDPDHASVLPEENTSPPIEEVERAD